MKLGIIDYQLFLQFYLQNMTQRQDKTLNITQTYHPMYRKGDFKYLTLHKRNNSTPIQRHPKTNLSYEIINSFSQISMQINQLQQFFRSRMEIHQQQILNIAHVQIKKIQADSQNVIRKYSKLIEERNLSKELLSLKYEIKFYQQRASQMFEENRKLKEEIKRLKSQILMCKIGQESDHIAMKNISKKYLKQKTIRKRLELSGLQRDPIDLQSNNNKIFSYTSVINPEHTAQKQKELSLGCLKSDKQSVSPLRQQFKLKLQKLERKEVKKLSTEPTPFKDKLIQF